jgi:hypothetical protein
MVIRKAIVDDPDPGSERYFRIFYSEICQPLLAFRNEALQLECYCRFVSGRNDKNHETIYVLHIALLSRSLFKLVNNFLSSNWCWGIERDALERERVLGEILPPRLLASLFSAWAEPYSSPPLSPVLVRALLDIKLHQPSTFQDAPTTACTKNTLPAAFPTAQCSPPLHPEYPHLPATAPIPLSREETAHSSIPHNRAKAMDKGRGMEGREVHSRALDRNWVTTGNGFWCAARMARSQISIA